MSQTSSLPFESHDNYASNLRHISASSAEELESMIAQLSGPVSIKTIYSSGARHFCWFYSTKPILIKKKKLKG